MDRSSWRERVTVVLVEPAHAGNVAAAARVMVVNGLKDLRLVCPRCGDPAEESWLAWGAEEVLHSSRIFADLAQCLADVTYSVGCTRRIRRRGWPQMAPDQAAQALRREAESGAVALVFGPERTGLHRTDLELCHARSAIPQGVAHPSYNLSHAVAIYAYELTRARGVSFNPQPEAASGVALQALRKHLEQALASRGTGAHRLARDLYRLWLRARPTESELRLLHRAILLMGESLTKAEAAIETIPDPDRRIPVP